MSAGLVAIKHGMTRVFTEAGDSIPVTVLKVEENRVSQIKKKETDGYDAVQIAFGKKAIARVNKPLRGHYRKVQVEPGLGLKEFRMESLENIELAQEWKADRFEVGQKVDVTAISKGKGFAGVIKRHNFRTQDATHGNSLAHRAPGSIGQCQWPGRVFKGKKMAGHMGNKRCSIQNLEVIKVDAEKNLILVKGAVPGAVSAKVVVSPAVKRKQNKKAGE